MVNRIDKAMPVRFVGESRHGYRVKNLRQRLLVESGTQGVLVKRAKNHCGHLVEFVVDHKRVRLYAPGWELRKLVKKK